MQYSTTQIVNLGHTHVGASHLESLENDQSEPAKAARAVFPFAFESFVQDWDWPWARKRALLAPVSTNPNGEWPFAHRLPPDCLIPRRIASGQRIDDESSEIPFELGVDTQGGLVYSAIDAPELVYTFLPANVTMVPPDAAIALSYKYASLAAPRLVREDPFEIVAKMERLYAMAIDKAKVSAELSERPGEFPDQSWKRARR